MLSKFGASAGFTMLELMTAVTVLGILLAVGVPAFTETIASNRLTTVANEMVTAVNVARSEASKRGIPVSVCAANAALTNCSGSATWNSGWIVFTDDQGASGELDGSDELLQTFAAPPEGYAVTATNPGTLTYIRFLRSGAPDSTAGAGRTLKLSRPACTGNKAREISIANTGRVSSGKKAC